MVVASMSDDFYTEEVVDCIMRAKAKMPAGWKIITETTDYWIVLHIPISRFVDFSITDQIRIAEVTNELCERIKTTGHQCYIQKV